MDKDFLSYGVSIVSYIRDMINDLEFRGNSVVGVSFWMNEGKVTVSVKFENSGDLNISFDHIYSDISSV